MTLPAEPRPYCYRCDKPLSMCVCGDLHPIPNAVGVHILQHPRERRHPLGTVRLLRLGLGSVRVHVLHLLGHGAASTPVELPEGAGLLYPSADARDLSTLTPEERPDHLVVIDGTWAHANRIYRDNAWVSALPHYRLSPAQGSRYRIRAEPRAECLSTVESVVSALRALEPALQGTEQLDAAFDAMIDAQIAAAYSGTSHTRSKRVRRRPPRHVPERLLAPDVRVIVVYAEAASPSNTPPGVRSPLRLCAVSLDDNRVFDAFVEVETGPGSFELEQMQITTQALASARPMDQVLRSFEESFGDGPVVLVSWGSWVHHWLHAHVNEVPSILLKGVWANLTHARVPALETVVERLGLDVPVCSVSGRAGLRLAQARAMTRHILEVASGAA